MSTAKTALKAPIITNNKKAKRRAKAIVRKDPNSQELVYRVPECVDHFLAALVDPFEAPPGACLPADLFPLPSSKNRVFVRTRMILGTSGIGFCALTPTGANDASFLQCTTSTSVGTSSTVFNSFTNLLNVNCTQNVYSSADFTNSLVQIRVVAGGLRCKYIGPLAARSGTVTLFEDPDHRDARTKTYDSVSSHPQSERYRVGDGKWDGEVVLSGPVTPPELEFQSEAYPLSTGSAPLLIAVNGVAGDLFDVEGYVHYEVIGAKIVNKTKSHAEPSFFAKAIEAAKSITSGGVLAPTKAKTLWESFKEGVSETLPQIVSSVSSMLMRGPGPMKALGLVGSLASSVLPPLLRDVHDSGSNSMRSNTLLLR